ncbi:protein amnionless [Conger conger]|uniref:protein amnionless n=1 Tax=Conger conger TaxID=82655 RepID=UPI002A5A6746|nr:protein amnionless [Conger conger]
MSPPLAVLISLCLFFGLPGSASCLYKQWVPDTSFENATNWDKGVVPCGSDKVQFLADRQVSVYVREVHSIQEMKLPVNGEFILASGAGFTVGGGQDSSCGTGVTVQFRDSETAKWFDPALWRAASSSEDLDKGRFLFSVHEESVPCSHDDVVFRPDTSFRVDTTAGQQSLRVKSVSVLGQKFRENAGFSRYLASRSGRLQFHGDAGPVVGSPACDDSSGCDCGNSVHHGRICSGMDCPRLDCTKPLRPVGHCCDVCGAILHLKISGRFNLETYRQRLQHLLLHPQYKAVRMGVSKVTMPQWLLGVIPREAATEIQVVLLDEEGLGPGTVAEDAARDIMKDIQSQGALFGIEDAELQASSGNEGTGDRAGVVVGAVLGALALVVSLVVLGFLFYRGVIRVPSLPSLPSWRKNSEIGELGGPIDHGFDNPMFNKPSQVPGSGGLFGTDSLSTITVTDLGVHFVNPAYDETNFNA